VRREKLEISLSIP